MNKLAVVHPIGEHEMNLIQKAAPDWEIIDAREPHMAELHIPDAEVILGWNAQAERYALTKHTALKWVQNWGAGVETFPLDRMREMNIQITNASGVHPFPISEHIFALMLTLTRHIHIAIRHQIQQNWGIEKKSIGEVHGRTIGILGVGSIGAETARLAKAFSMKVIGLRRSGEPVESVDIMYDYNGLHNLLAESDYVVNCLPATSETEHFMGAEQFKAMKKGAFYINIGRGATTDTEALVNALESQSIAGAGLDVFEEEPLGKHHPLWAMEQVIITPHTAGISTSYTERIMSIFIHNLMRYVQGDKPDMSVVNIQSGY
ncbi:phosphoglycerate dehydrogenase-like enzyme [Paenibacillus shirakamiensis]|uniref:Phosphoglycerate dehydrogenase-like enzyme n=1 Tax=Paenibacillus shirakamiensis TaxID=1265935 RepID=A0ABS4JI37_9BACL|nr:D-2-hydroxyacid dehydrogenase [Paenibacillus shirakamiensis]MBP2001352.1 phosphoglycerate dehydrogenase-like enzyme [Paenibacillus shirakamiensis]